MSGLAVDTAALGVQGGSLAGIRDDLAVALIGLSRALEPAQGGAGDPAVAAALRELQRRWAPALTLLGTAAGQLSLNLVASAAAYADADLSACPR